MIALARRIWLQAGAELVAQGALDAAGDVIFLCLDDLLAFEAGQAGDMRARAANARAEYERERTRRAVPRWMTSDGEAIFGVQAEESDGVLMGLPVSAGPLVMETGGAVSHGPIVAREYGLPAVAGVADATTRLQDGQRGRVNGQSGRVILLDIAREPACASWSMQPSTPPGSERN